MAAFSARYLGVSLVLRLAVRTKDWNRPSEERMTSASFQRRRLVVVVFMFVYVPPVVVGVAGNFFVGDLWGMFVGDARAGC